MIMELYNPYCFGFPLNDGDAFVGRRRILTDIFRNLRTAKFSTKISLFGARRIGTTSLLLSIANKETQKQYSCEFLSGWKFVMLDLKELTSLSPESLTFAFLQAISQSLGMELHSTSDPYTDLKRTADKIDDGGHKMLVLLDEADRLLEMGNDYVFMDQFFYALLNRPNKSINMIVGSKRPLYEIFVLCRKRFTEDMTSPFFVHFRPLRVGLFSIAEVKELVIGLSQRSGLSLEKEFRQIIQMGGRFPQFLQIACFLTFEAKRLRSEISQSQWQGIKEEFETQVYPYYNYLWESLTDFERRIVVDIATKKPALVLPTDYAKIAKDISGHLMMVWADVPPTYRAELLTMGVNSQSRNEMEAGTTREDEFSEWLWSLLYQNRMNLRLFSESFGTFVIEKSKQLGPIGLKAIVPGIMMTLYSNLRKHFQETAPISEADVQRAIQLILDAAGYEFTREGEQFVFSLKGWRPDHSSAEGVAIEAKLCKTNKDVKRIVEEISADIIPYRSKYKAVVIVVYDLGNIQDEVRFRRDFEKLDGVYVLIRKH